MVTYWSKNRGQILVKYRGLTLVKYRTGPDRSRSTPVPEYHRLRQTCRKLGAGC